MSQRDSLGREHGLVAWQWSDYPRAHADRRNLVMHALSTPVFIASVIGLPITLAVGAWITSASCVAALVLVAAVQGLGHRLEREGPAPFRGPFDVVARLFVEQLVTFPRFVLSGRFARAWSTEQVE